MQCDRARKGTDHTFPCCSVQHERCNCTAKQLNFHSSLKSVLWPCNLPGIAVPAQPIGWKSTKKLPAMRYPPAQTPSQPARERPVQGVRLAPLLHPNAVCFCSSAIWGNVSWGHIPEPTHLAETGRTKSLRVQPAESPNYSAVIGLDGMFGLFRLGSVCAVGRGRVFHNPDVVGRKQPVN